ncbi:hypothetical protein [Clostridium botulinum]|nr:hypothetical protein [Clostridium botulinum]
MKLISGEEFLIEGNKEEKIFQFNNKSNKLIHLLLNHLKTK